MLLVVIAAILSAWWRDHRQMDQEIVELTAEVSVNRKSTTAWGVEQMVGEPDTTGSGDMRTAWASGTQDQQKEWVLVEFENEVNPAEILVHETYNPGALYKVSIFDPLGREVVVWEGKDPTPTTALRGISKVPVNTIWKTKRVKIYLDSPKVPGWNEIDTIGLKDKAGNTQWPRYAKASSDYAARYGRGSISGFSLDVFNTVR